MGTNNSGAADVLVRRDGADLRLAKTKTPNPVALGSAMVSTITVTNDGPRTATGPLLVVEALSGELFVAASGSGWTCTVVGAAVVCEHPNTGGLAVGAALPNLLITSTATVAGAARNEACTGNSLPTGVAPGQARPPAEGDPNASNDCVTVSATSTTLRPDLAISKTALTPVGGDSIVSVTENSVTYRLVVDNASPGSDAASGVRISDGVPGFIADRSSFGSISTTVSAGTATFACSGSTAASQRGRRAGRAGEQCGDGGRWW